MVTKKQLEKAGVEKGDGLELILKTEKNARLIGFVDKLARNSLYVTPPHLTLFGDAAGIKIEYCAISSYRKVGIIVQYL